MRKIPLLIDTDPGGDDAIAIMMAKACGLYDIVAICPVNGNSPLRDTKRNAMDLACYYDIDTRVAIGANEPLYKGLITNSNFKRVAKMLKKEGEDEDFQYGGQMFDFKFPAPTKEFDAKPAWDVIYEEAVKAEGELVILAIGPLTNLALALAKYNDLPKLIKEIVVMGGSAYAGNHTPYGEFNVLIDPYAFAAVLKWGIPFKMVGLDATAQAYHTIEELGELAEMDTTIAPMLKAAYDGVVARNNDPNFPPRWKGRTTYHDALAMASMIDPSICEFQHCHVEIELASPIAFGQTVVDKRPVAIAGQPNCYVATKVDREKYIKLVKDCVATYKKEDK